MAGARERQPGLRTTASRLEGPPAPVLAGLTREARMVVLGSRHLGRLEEFLSAVRWSSRSPRRRTAP
ncbi:hypothetical protein ACIRPN_24850 [Streptomyces sp. NPDC101230]|uniref:hypothetical protein n=1 Tax=unclassified Streptomyces TaxID=2593676 RepID=UPI0037F42E1B